MPAKKSSKKTAAQINAETKASEPKPADRPEPTPEPSAETRALAAEGNVKTDPDDLRAAAQAQDEVRKAELDPANDEQPGITSDPPEGEPVSRDELPDVEKPNVFSSQDMSSTKVDPDRLNDSRNANSTLFNRDPSDTEAKLAEQGLIPPIRR